MKKIINGKRYDTETAEYIGSTSWGDGPSDFNHWSEELYRKRTGEFFIYGEGGPNSKYSKSLSYNEWSGSEELRPITEDEAKEWVEDYLDGDDYEKLWPVVEDDSKKTTSIMLSSDAYDKLKKMSADKGLSMSQIIEGMVLDLSAD